MMNLHHAHLEKIMTTFQTLKTTTHDINRSSKEFAGHFLFFKICSILDSLTPSIPIEIDYFKFNTEISGF